MVVKALPARPDFLYFRQFLRCSRPRVEDGRHLPELFRNRHFAECITLACGQRSARGLGTPSFLLLPASHLIAPRARLFFVPLCLRAFVLNAPYSKILLTGTTSAASGFRLIFQTSTILSSSVISLGLGEL